MVECNVDDCGKDATYFYTWAWGEEGACCDAHRSHLESKSAQLGREITFTPRKGSRADYKAPTIREISPEVAKLRMLNAELGEDLKKANARCGELELRVMELEGQLDELRARPDDETGPTLSVVEGERPPTKPPPR